MVARWLLAIALSVQVTFALASNDPVRDNWNNHLKNQEAYHQNTQRAAAEVRASISMTPEKKANVKQLLERSGVAIDGSKVKIGSSVTRPVNTAKAAAALAERFKNAGQYAKKFGKASLPGFVGSAAFYGLMEGVDYVMDPKNNTIVRQPTDEDGFLCSSSNPCRGQYIWKMNFDGLIASSTSESLIKNAYEKYTLSGGYYTKVEITITSTKKTDTTVVYNHTSKYTDKNGNTNTSSGGLQYTRINNPDYDPNHTVESIPVSDSELLDALKNALESNNPALAAAIAEALKAAYSQDNSEGQPGTTNPLIAEIGDDMQRAVDSAFDNPTNSTGTSERPGGHYKITDGDKTIEGWVNPSDTNAHGTTDSTTTPNPDGSSTTTGTASQQWPAFCDWAGIVCEFIDWTKEDEQLPEEKPEDIDDSIFNRKFDFDFNMGASCPPNPIWNFEFVGHAWSKEIDITRICDFFKYLGYAIVFASNMTALWVVYGAVTVREQA